MIEVLLIASALVLVVACGAFVAAEFAFVTVDRATVDRAARDGDASAQGIQAALRSLSTQLSGAQLGITLTNLLIGFLAEPAIADAIDQPLESAGVPSGAVPGVALVIALTVSTGFTMVFGELVPKNLAIARPLETARAVQRFMRVFTRVNGPVIRAFNGMANRVLGRLGVEPQEELASARSPQELMSLVRRSVAQGTLAPQTAALLQRSLAFATRRAEDVMTPRVRMQTLEAGQPVADVIALTRATGLSRFPVIGESPDEVVGIVHVKQAVAIAHGRRGEVPVRSVMVAPALVPSTIELDPLLATLRNGGLQIAVVVDEFGGVDGIVTFEDVVEEIVGEVTDEHDRPTPAARRAADGSWLLSGLLRPDEASGVTGLRLPEDDEYETLAGLLGLHLGHLPSVGEAIQLPSRDSEGERRVVTLTVARMDGLRVDRIRLDHAPLTEPDHDDEHTG